MFHFISSITAGFTFALISIIDCVTFCFFTGLEISSGVIGIDRFTIGKFLALEPSFRYMPTRICNLVGVKVIGGLVDSFRVLKEDCGLVKLEKTHNKMLQISIYWLYQAKSAFLAWSKLRDYLTHFDKKRKILLHFKSIKLVAFVAESAITIEVWKVVKRPKIVCSTSFNIAG